MIGNVIPERVRHLRVEVLKVSAAELGSWLGVSDRSVHNWEAARTGIGGSTLLLLSRVLSERGMPGPEIMEWLQGDREKVVWQPPIIVHT